MVPLSLWDHECIHLNTIISHEHMQSKAHPHSLANPPIMLVAVDGLRLHATSAWCVGLG
jgi:hypothetical protein